MFQIYQAFATAEETTAMRTNYADGIAWGEAKQVLFEYLDNILAEPREKYNELMANPQKMEQRLLEGAEKARAISVPFLQDLRSSVGLSPLSWSG